LTQVEGGLLFIFAVVVRDAAVLLWPTKAS